MKLTANFEVPAGIAGRLASGEMVRRGGVIQWAEGTQEAGKVVAWLREAAPRPSAPADLVNTLGKMGTVLQLVGTATSVVSLGATLGFGIATLRKLGKMDAKLDALVDGQERLLQGQAEALRKAGDMDAKLDTLVDGQERLLQGQTETLRTLDVGFWQISNGFARLLDGQARIEAKLDEKFHEQIEAALRSATADMDLLVATLPRDDARRVIRVEQILARISPASELLARDAENRTEAVAKGLESCTSGRTKLDITGDAVIAMYRLRMACSAAALMARVVAESGQTREAAHLSEERVRRFRVLIHRVGSAVFAGPATVYDDLLHHYWSGRGVSPGRLGMWGERFDPEAGDLEGVLRRIQVEAAKGKPIDQPQEDLKTHLTILRGDLSETSWTGPPMLSQVVGNVLRDVVGEARANLVMRAVQRQTGYLTAVDENITWSAEAQKNAIVFFDLLDGAWEDIDRLEGHAIEYAEMSRRRLDVSDYAERLRVEDVPDGERLLLFTEEVEEAEPNQPVLRARAKPE